MATISYCIDRYNKDDNEIIKTHVDVVRAARDFSRFTPLSAKRKRLIREVGSILTADAKDTAAKRQHELSAMSLPDGMEDFAESAYAPSPAEVLLLRAFRRYNNSTLSAIIVQFGGGRFHGAISWLLTFDKLGECAIRESLPFRHVCSEEDKSVLPDILNDVRLSQEVFRRQDLSELDADPLRKAAAVAAVALALFRQDDTEGRKYLASMRGHMTPVLSRVITENVDRTQEIIDYTRLYGLTAEQVNTQHLMDYLENPTISLSEGVL